MQPSHRPSLQHGAQLSKAEMPPSPEPIAVRAAREKFEWVPGEGLRLGTRTGTAAQLAHPCAARRMGQLQRLRDSVAGPMRWSRRCTSRGRGGNCHGPARGSRSLHAAVNSTWSGSARPLPSQRPSQPCRVGACVPIGMCARPQASPPCATTLDECREGGGWFVRGSKAVGGDGVLVLRLCLRLFGWSYFRLRARGRLEEDGLGVKTHSRNTESRPRLRQHRPISRPPNWPIQTSRRRRRFCAIFKAFSTAPIDATPTPRRLDA